MFSAVLRIHEILVRIRNLWLMDPDPAIFVNDLQDVNKKLLLNTFLRYFYLIFQRYNVIKKQ